MFKTFPEFGKELRRPFEVHENCYDCARFYDGCEGWRASRDFECRGCNRLPDVLPGTCGQRFPATTRKLAAMPVDMEPEGQPGADQMPTLPMSAPAQAQGEVAPRNGRTERPPERTRTQSPATSYGLDDERLCECGAALQRRKRCCETCRQERRKETMRRRRRSTAVDVGSGLPFAGPGRPSTSTRSGAHN